jgi:hypothetical protein
MIGFLTEEQADEYFATRIGGALAWSSGVDKVGALTTAYNDLLQCNKYVFLEIVSGEVADELIFAQCEQAFFLLLQGIGLDRRKGLQDQGVVDAGIVKESYKVIDGIAICNKAAAALRDYRLFGAGLRIEIE